MTRDQWVKTGTPAQRRQWAKEHPLAWVMEYQPVILLPGKGYQHVELFEYQQRFLKDSSDYRATNKARQIGYTTVAALEIAFYASRGRGEQIVIISKDEDAAKEFLRYVKSAIRSVMDVDPDFCPVVLNKGQIGTQTLIEFTDGSRIQALAASQEAGRSISASRLYFDEVAFTPFVEDIYQAIEPTLSQTKGKMTMFSTPKGKGNLFARICKNPSLYGFSYHQYEWWWCPTYNPYYEQWYKALEANDLVEQKKWIEKAKQGDWYKKKRARHNDLSFRQEFECSFDADADTAFTQAQLDNVFYTKDIEKHYIVDDVSVEIHWRKGERIPGHSYVTAVDFGRKRDPSVLITYDITPEVAEMVEYRRLAPGMFTWEEILLAVRQNFAYYESDMYADATGIGDVIFESIEDIATPVIISGGLNSRVKFNIVAIQQKAMDYRVISMPKIPQLYQEFERYTWADKGIVQDSVMANGMAVIQFYDPETLVTGAITDFSFVPQT